MNDDKVLRPEVTNAGQVSWHMSPEMSKLLAAVPAEDAQRYRIMMGQMILLCAHAITNEINFAVRTGCHPMTDMQLVMQTLAEMQRQRQAVEGQESMQTIRPN